MYCPNPSITRRMIGFMLVCYIVAANVAMADPATDSVDAPAIDENAVTTPPNTTPPSEVSEGQPDIDATSEPAAFAELRVTVTLTGDEIAPLPGAKILITYENGDERKGVTDEQGVATLPDLPFGTVAVDVAAPGMQSAAADLLLDQEIVQANFALRSRPIPPPASD